MLKLAFALLIFVVSHPASAGIYKCVGKGGIDLYQNFPCSIDSLGSMPQDPQIQFVDQAASTIESKQTQTPPSGVAQPGEPLSGDASPRLGMTAEQVRAIWGEPAGDTIHGLVPISHPEIAGRSIEIWTYSTTRFVQFDQSGHVSAFRP